MNKYDELIIKRRDKMIYRDGTQKMKTFGDSYPESDILNEALNQMRAQEALESSESVKVPHVLEVAIIDERWTIVSEYIKGKTLDELMLAEPENLEKHLSMMVGIQMEISGANVVQAADLIAKMHHKIDKTDLSEDTREELHESLDKMPNHTKLCHGDFNPTNIIIGEDGLTYIIDWSHLTKGNLSADAARTHLWLMFEKGRETAEKYLDIFCRVSGTDSEYVKRWVRTVAAAAIPKAEEKEAVFLHSCI